MESFEAHSFLMILKESIKLLPKNGKLMALIALFSVLVSSTLTFLLSFTLQSLVQNMFVTIQTSFMPDLSSFNSASPVPFTAEKGPDPTQMFAGPLGRVREDFGLLLAVQIAFVLAISIVSFVSTISTVIVSAVSYTSTNLSLKELISRLRFTWTRPFVTTLYVSALAMGYIVAVAILVAPLLVYATRAAFCVATLLGVVSLVFYLYICVAWAVAVVVSVVEQDCYGALALGRAARLVKGKCLNGFLINICSNLVVLIIYQGYKMIASDNKVFVSPTLYGLFVVNVCVVAKIMLVVAYTVLYFHCKKENGEEVELNVSTNFEYTKVSNAQIV